MNSGRQMGLCWVELLPQHEAKGRRSQLITYLRDASQNSKQDVCPSKPLQEGSRYRPTNYACHHSSKYEPRQIASACSCCAVCDTTAERRRLMLLYEVATTFQCWPYLWRRGVFLVLRLLGILLSRQSTIRYQTACSQGHSYSPV